jgi:hypothetical protein
MTVNPLIYITTRRVEDEARAELEAGARVVIARQPRAGFSRFAESAFVAAVDPEAS